MDDRYSNREIDAMQKAVIEKVDVATLHLADRLADFEKDTRESLSRIEVQVSYTNGKVKKIVLALVLLSGVCIGLGFQQIGPVLSLIL